MNNLSFDRQIIDCWRAAVRADFVKKGVVDKLKQFINEINPYLANLNTRFHFETRNVTAGTSYITNDEGSVSVYIILPTTYPTNDGTTVGPFFVRVNDERHSRNESRLCINLEKIESTQQLAEVIGNCLLHPEDINSKYIRHGIITTENEARKKLVAQY